MMNDISEMTAKNAKAGFVFFVLITYHSSFIILKE